MLLHDLTLPVLLHFCISLHLQLLQLYRMLMYKMLQYGSPGRVLGQATLFRPSLFAQMKLVAQQFRHFVDGGDLVAGAYIARQAAKSVVASGLAQRCLVQISYAIGVAQPLSVHVDTYGTGKKPDKAILAAVLKAFDFRPGAPSCYVCWCCHQNHSPCIQINSVSVMQAWCKRSHVCAVACL